MTQTEEVMTQSDDELIQCYLSGQSDAFDALYQRYAGRLLGFVISLGASADTAQDLAQQAWLKVIDSLETYDHRGQFRSWLFTVARRIWLDEAQSAWSRRVGSLDDEQHECQSPTVTEPDAQVIAETRQQREQIEQALTHLPDEMRQTVLLRIDADMKYREIAEEMNCPLGTVLWRMKEAVKRLREQIELENTEVM